MAAAFAQAAILRRILVKRMLAAVWFATYLLADSGKTTSFSPLMHRVANPVYSGVSSNLSVHLTK